MGKTCFRTVTRQADKLMAPAAHVINVEQVSSEL